jgi:hypothetical protein
MSGGQAYVFLGGSAGLAQSPAVTMSSDPGSNAQFGAFVAGAGDLNGDGFADVVVGAMGTPSGNAYVYYGARAGPPSTASVTLAGTDGPQSGFGWSVAGGGDLNADGFDELLVSAVCAVFQHDPDGGYPTCGTGRSYVFTGSATGIATTPAVQLQGVNLGDAFGWVSHGAGDIDGDGFDDMLISAPAVDMFDGTVHLFLGRSTVVNATPSVTLLPGAGMSLNFGWSVALAAPRARTLWDLGSSG